MINKIFIKKLKTDYQVKGISRRKIISRANEVLFLSKKTIFALHRNNEVLAKENFKLIEITLKDMERNFTYERLKEEGAYQAAIEEYVEAKTLSFIIIGKKIDKIKGFEIGHDSYIGGLCDLIGEMVRLATNRAAKGDYESASTLKDQAEEIMMELLDFDLTGYLRTKYDQARGHLRKLEQITYDIKIHKDK
ncbi:MAG: hypothetical protein EOM88_02570 [Clostridia bacterium]|nr:hypothetical protein [Clostridia bacterium]